MYGTKSVTTETLFPGEKRAEHFTMYKLTLQCSLVLSKDAKYAEMADHSITGQEVNQSATKDLLVKWTESKLEKCLKDSIELLASVLRGLREIHLVYLGETSITLELSIKRKGEVHASDQGIHSVSGQYAEILNFIVRCHFTFDEVVELLASLPSTIIIATSVLPTLFDANHLFQELFRVKYQRVRSLIDAFQNVNSDTSSYESALERLVVDAVLNRPGLLDTTLAKVDALMEEICMKADQFQVKRPPVKRLRQFVIKLLDKDHLTADQSEVRSRQKTGMASDGRCFNPTVRNFVEFLPEEVSSKLRWTDPLCSIILQMYDKTGADDSQQLEKYIKNCIIFDSLHESFQCFSFIGDFALIISEVYETQLDACIQCNKNHFLAVVEWNKIQNGLVSVTDDLAKYLALAKSLGSHMITQSGNVYLQDLEKLMKGNEAASIFHDLHSRRAQQDSNEEPFRRQDEWKLSLKNDLNSRSDAEEATTEAIQSRVEHLDPKDRHPLGERLGSQTRPERIEETSPFGDIMYKKHLTIPDPQGYDIPLHSSLKPHPSPSPLPRPSEECTEPPPAVTPIHSSDLSARLDEKSCEPYCRDVKERGKLFSRRDVSLPKKGFEHSCDDDDDIVEEADAGYRHRTEPNGIPLTENLPPAAPKTTAGITGQQEQAEDKHYEIEESAADSRSLSAPKMEVPQTDLSQERLLGSERPFEDVSLRYKIEKLYVELEYQTNRHGASPVQNTPTEVGSSMTTQNEESSALGVPSSSGEFRSVSRWKVLTENGSEDRGQTSETNTPEPPRQSVTGELTSGYDILPAKDEILPAVPSYSDSNFEPQPQESGNAQEMLEGGVYSVDKLEILLEEFCRGIDVTTRAHLPEMNSLFRPADEDYVSLAESKGNFLPQGSHMDVDERSRLGTVPEPFFSVNDYKKLESSERVETSEEDPSKEICFDRISQSMAEPQRVAAPETFVSREESVVTDQPRDSVHLGQLLQENGTLFHFRPLLSSWDFLRGRSLTITIRPFFPDLQNGAIEVDSRNPVRETMNVEGFRLCTFLYCPNTEALPALRLANAGFYYTGRDGVVACYSCDLRCRHNDARLQGDPYALHREMNRHCPHINNMNQGHLFIQDHQTTAHSGRDITGSPSEGTRGEQISVREMTATTRQATGHALNEFQRRVGALSTVSTETSATGRAAQHGTEGGSPCGPHSVSSLHSSGEGAENTPAASTNTITNTATNNTARQDSPASQHPAVVEATVRTTSSQTASSAASHQVSNTSLLNSGRGQLATGGRDTGNGNRSALYATTERSYGDITSSSGVETSENPVTERPPQEDLESRQTSSRPNNVTVPTVLTSGQRAYAPSRGNDETIAGNVSRTSRPRMGLLGGSSAQVYSAINENPSAVNHTTHGGEAPPAPRQVETVAPSDAVPPAPPLPAYDPSRAVHRQYTAIETRKRSFLGRWPDTHAQSPEDLAEAGFFYAGAEDCVRCHYCGLGLKHWDPDDRPLEEHMRWRSSCGFLRDLVGEEEITRTLARIGRRPNGSAGQPAAGRASARSPRGLVPNGNSPQMTSPGLHAETERFMTSEVVITAREMGFPDDSIRRGIDALLHTSAGRRAVTSQNLVHAILFLRERGRDLESPTPNNTNVVDVSSDESDDETAPLPPNDSQTNRRANALENVSGSGLVGHAAFPPNRDGMVYFAHTEQSGSDGNVGQQARSHRSSPNSSSPSQSRQTPAHADASMNGQDGAQTIRQLEQENQELRERRRCKICLDNDVNILFMPCGHLVCCAECAPALRRCPICRRRVSGTVSIQFAGVPSGQLQ